MKKINWGILSTAKIGMSKVIPAMQKSQHCNIMAIASQQLTKAQSAAQQLGISSAYGSYEALLGDPDIDAIYISLPNHLHVPWSIKAIAANKHVLCEKPIALDATQAKQLQKAVDNAPHLKVMEAFMYRHHPQWLRAKQLVNTGAIGQLQTIESFFSYHNNDANNIRNIAELGGGGLMDIGCYCISLSRFIYNAEPIRVSAEMKFDKKFNTDYLTNAMLDFGYGTASFTCSTQLSPYQRVNILGTLGRIEIEIPFNAPNDMPCKIWLHDQAGNVEEMVFETCDQYSIQGDLFSLSILNDTPVPTPIVDAVANMEIIDRIKKSAQSTNWENCHDKTR
ncbi:MAG: Gfo/Idh/MocA family oxidoreductase [Paraglaciecola sp.]|nr:Gfo/Idh/MocA family oxidoreductase [Paraglaciecola sp.]